MFPVPLAGGAGTSAPHPSAALDLSFQAYGAPYTGVGTTAWGNPGSSHRHVQLRMGMFFGRVFTPKTTFLGRGPFGR